jgi:hypothetical protein
MDFRNGVALGLLLACVANLFWWHNNDSLRICLDKQIEQSNKQALETHNTKDAK